MNKLVLGVLVLFAALPSLFGAGLIIADESQWLPWPPRPIPPERPPIRPPHRFAPLELVRLQVDTSIKDQVATTTVEQEFHNPNSSTIEGSFIFPVPKDSHLDKFVLTLDGKKLEAELLPAEKAQRIYEDIVRRAKDPGLLEYAGSDLYKVRIFPIGPHRSRQVRLSYTQLLPSDQGLVSYQLPLSPGKFSAKPIQKVLVKMAVETSKPLKSIFSPTHTLEIKRSGSREAVAVYEGCNLDTVESLRLYFAPETDPVGMNLLTYRHEGEDGYFLLLASPGVDVTPRNVVPKDVVFVLDTSGSMAGKKLEQAKKALLFCIANLGDEDQFEVVRFSTDVEPLFEKTVPANSENRAKAESFVRNLKPIGGTAIAEALQASAKMASASSRERVFMMIFLTDGQPTIGDTNEKSILAGLKRANASGNRVFCFGIGADVNTHLLDQVSSQTRGFSQYVLPEEDLELKLSSFYSKIREPVLANPALTFTGKFSANRTYPPVLPDLFRGEQLVLVGRFRGEGPGAAVLEGTVNGGKQRFAFDLDLSEKHSSSDFIPRLWATRRVGALLDEIRLQGENSELREEVTALARQYGIVTPYTAYLIVEDEARRNIPESSRSLQQFDSDHEARQQVGAAWSEFKTKRSGEAAVADAGQGSVLASSSVAGVDQEARARFMRRYGLRGGLAGAASAPDLAANPEAAKATRVAQYSQQSRYVAGKTFFQNGDLWIDGAVQTASNAPVRKVVFGSPEYFTLLAKHPNAAPWLALGQRVNLLLGDTVYEISGLENGSAPK
jgi:Ca-activated chloride channel family protein